jgi:hypothetical protein
MTTPAHSDLVSSILEKKSKALFKSRVLWQNLRPGIINNTFVLTPMDVYSISDMVYNNVKRVAEEVSLKSLTKDVVVVVSAEVFRKQEEGGMLTEIYHTDNQDINTLIQDYIKCVTK